jgi:putative ABC transport system permease protein
MPSSYEAKIAKVPGVKAVTMWQWFGGVYKDARDPKNFFMRMAAEPAALFDIFQRDRTGCIAAKALADRQGWKLGQHIAIVGDIFYVNLDLTLDGIFDTPDHLEMLFFNHDYLRESLSGPARAIDTMFDNSLWEMRMKGRSGISRAL